MSQTADKIDLNGTLDVASVVADDGTIIANSIVVGDGRTLSVTGSSVIDTELLPYMMVLLYL